MNVAIDLEVPAVADVMGTSNSGNMAYPIMRTYEIIYRLKTGNSGQQRAVVKASDPGTARRIFEQQNPGCTFHAWKEVK